MAISPSAELPAATRALTRRQEALSLSVANALDRVLQFGMPLALTRLLSLGDFGQYRIFWLVTLTVSGLAPLGMPRGLFYFLPRSDRAARRAYVDNTLVFLLASGIACGLLVIGTGGAAQVPAARTLVPIFVVLWIVTSLLDLLPSADQRIRWQAGAIVGLSVLRVILILGAALTRNVYLVFAALMGFALLKLGVLGFYVGRHYGWHVPRVDKPSMVEQVRYSVPFGVDSALYTLRGNAEHWIVVFLFLPAQYAVFSITAYLVPLVDVVRGSLANVLLPRMSETLARGDTRGMLGLNVEGNLAAAAVIFPSLAFLFANAHEILIALFPAPYESAAPIMRIYVLALARVVIETTGVLMVLKQGRFIMGVGAVALVVAGVCSYAGARVFGVPGAALGGLTAYYVEAGFSFRRISRITGLPIQQLQDWPALWAVLAAAVLSAAASRAYLAMVAAASPLLLSLGISAVIMTTVYWCLLRVFGYGWIPLALIGRSRWRPPTP